MPFLRAEPLRPGPPAGRKQREGARGAEKGQGTATGPASGPRCQTGPWPLVALLAAGDKPPPAPASADSALGRRTCLPVFRLQSLLTGQ